MKILWIVLLFITQVFCANKQIVEKTSHEQLLQLNSRKLTAIHDRYILGHHIHPNRTDPQVKLFTHGTNNTDNNLKQKPSNFLLLKRRLVRSKDYDKSLTSVDFLTTQYMYKGKQCAVDTKICDCYRDPQTNRSNINCRYKELNNIPIFVEVDTVYYQITLSANNYITRLPFDAFKNLKVNRIDMLDNKLSSVQPGAFNGLDEYLQELLIEGNGMNGMEIPFNTMTKLKLLRRLTLKNFKQDRLSEINQFGYFPNLEALEFKSVSVAYIDTLAFKDKLTKLLQLVLDNVELLQVPVDSLKYLPSITKLYIKFTNINTIYSRSFDKQTSLIDLDLSFNKIQTMETDAFIGVSNLLTHLDLSTNQLQPSSLQALSSKQWNNLEHLTLSYNKELTHMPENVFKYMSKLQYLYLDNMNLVHISRDMFAGLNNLFALDLSWNSIETIQDRAFYHMNKLYELKIEYQFQSGSGKDFKAFEMYPGAFNGLQNNLVYLYLESTTLKSKQFWKTVRIFTALQQLQISKTKLSEIPRYAFNENKKLHKIELNNNGIMYLNKAAFKGLEHTLKDLSLNENNLTTINKCIFMNFTNLNYIRLHRNKLECDCRLKWLQTFILQKNETDEYFLINDYICSTPVMYANKYLGNIPHESLICDNDVAEQCTDEVHTTVTTRSPPTQTPTTADKDIVNSLKLKIASRTSSSITIVWSITDKSRITGFKLEYKLTTQTERGQELYIHRDEFSHTLYNLIQGSFYQLCVTAETMQGEDESVEDCRTARTIGESSSKQGHDDAYIPIDKGGESRNVIIGVIIATVASVVLIAVGVCAVVKYKIQKLKELQFALALPRHRNACADEDGMKVCAVPNEYSEIDNAAIARKYNIKCSKTMQRQFGVDNYSYDSGEESSQYNTYQKIGKGRRKNPYENDEEDEPVQLSTDSDEVYFRNELELRHSAPSRLDAGDLKNQYGKNVRPLPATPADKDKQKRSSTLKPIKKVKTGKKQMLEAQVSVYKNEKQIEEPFETQRNNIHSPE